VRHNLVQQIIKAYEEFDSGQASRGAGRGESGKHTSAK
jgi:hypothetical protein